MVRKLLWMSAFAALAALAGVSAHAQSQEIVASLDRLDGRGLRGAAPGGISVLHHGLVLEIERYIRSLLGHDGRASPIHAGTQTDLPRHVDVAPRDVGEGGAIP